MKDHPLYHDPDYLKANTIREWIALLQKHLNNTYDQKLEEILVNLNYCVNELELVENPAESVSDSTAPIVFPFSGFIRKVFDESNDLSSVLKEISRYATRQFKVWKHGAIENPSSFNFFKFYQKAEWANFCEFLRAKINYIQYYEQDRRLRFASLRLLYCFEIVADLNHEELKKTFVAEFQTQACFVRFFELGVRLQNWLIENGHIPKPDQKKSRSKVRSVSFDPDICLDPDGLLATFRILDSKLRNDEGLELKLNTIYQKFGLVTAGESVPEPIVSATRQKIVAIKNEKVKAPRTMLQAMVRALELQKELTEEAESSSSAPPLVIFSVSSCANRPALRQHVEPSANPIIKNHF